MSLSSKQLKRNQLEKRLLKSRSELIWSYNKCGLNSLSDEIIINRFLLYGDSKDWDELKQAFDQEKIQKVWEDDLLLSGFMIEKQREIVRYFFKTKNPSSFILKRKKKKLEEILISNS